MVAVREQVRRRPGLYLTGSIVAGTGLAAVVADARTVAAAVLAAQLTGRSVRDVG